MGVDTIMKAKKVYLMAWGEGKSNIISRTVEGTISDQVPATFLQQHDDCVFVLDSASASELTRQKTPWLVSLSFWFESNPALDPKTSSKFKRRSLSSKRWFRIQSKQVYSPGIKQTF